MIGAIYSTFDGLNLIRTSLESIKDAVDFVVIVHQRTDFYGNHDDENARQIFRDLYKDKLIHSVLYTDSAIIEPKEHTMIRKRNAGLDSCRKAGCDYVLIMDADECYNSNEIKNTITDMQTNNIDTAYSPIVTFYKDMHHYYNDVYYVPSIYKMNDRTFGFFRSSIICDALRQMKEGNYKLYSNLNMYHLSYVNNLRNKYRSSLARGSDKINTNMNLVCDHFDKWQEGDDALVFNDSGDLIVKKLLITNEILWR